MGSGSFAFNISDTKNNNIKSYLNVNNSQIEIDASYEGVKSLTVFEAKRDYTDAARYLGLINKSTENRTPLYSISQNALHILNLSFKQRQLKYCRLILSHKAFNDSLKIYFKSGSMPSIEQIIAIMKNSNAYKLESENTFRRRASTIRGWLNWIVSLINE